jgi:hypothetical protein
VGNEINPKEFLYFRQDNPKNNKVNSCKHEKCWNSPVGASDYCDIHLKMFKEKGINIMTKVSQKVKDWPKFMKDLKNQVDKENPNTISFNAFLKLLNAHHVDL